MFIRILKEVFFYLFLLIISFSFFSAPVFAQTNQNPVSPWIGTSDSFVAEVESGSASLGNFNVSVFSNLLRTIGAATTGAKVCPSNQKTCYLQGGAAQMVENATMAMYSNKPASSIEYLADIGSRLNIVKPAYAQGLGFTTFSQILPLWKIFRNLAYIFYIVIFFVIGLMIMFRKKIDPRTVITIQDALPRIVFSLLLVTFSYALAGLFIDIGDMATRLIGGAFSGFIALTPGTLKTDPVALKQLFQYNTFQLVNPIRDTTALSAAFSGINLGFGGAFAALAGLTLGFLFSIASLFVMIKIFFALLTPYVSILLQVILSPLQLMLAAIPSSNNGITGWIRSFLSNILVFPLTFGMLAIAAIIKGGTATACAAGDPNCAQWGISPNTDFFVTWSPATIGRGWGASIGQLAAFGILFMIPKVADMVKEALEYKPKSWESGGGLGQGITGIASKLPVIGGLVGEVSR